jgi:hypothetical protein
MKPLRSLLGYALRHKKIPANPFDLLTEDDRADDDGERFVLAKTDELDRRPEAKQEYAPFVHAAIETASRAHARGVTLQDLSMVMGHSSVDITAQVYVRLYGREQAEERFRQAMAARAN